MTAGPLRRAAARFDAAAGAVAKAGAVCGGALLLLMVGHVMLEIVLRTVFASSTFVLDEFVGYGVAAVTFLCVGYAFQEGALIRVGLGLEACQRMPRLRQAIEILCSLIAAVAAWFVTWYFSLSVWRHLIRGNRSETIAQVPLWLPEGLMLVGLGIFSLRVTAYALRLACGQGLLESDRVIGVDERADLPAAAGQPVGGA